MSRTTEAINETELVNQKVVTTAAAPAASTGQPTTLLQTPTNSHQIQISLALCFQFLSTNELLSVYKVSHLWSSAASHPLTFRGSVRFLVEHETTIMASSNGGGFSVLGGKSGISVRGPQCKFSQLPLLRLAAQSRLFHQFKILHIRSMSRLTPVDVIDFIRELGKFESIQALEIEFRTASIAGSSASQVIKTIQANPTSASGFTTTLQHLRFLHLHHTSVLVPLLQYVNEKLEYLKLHDWGGAFARGDLFAHLIRRKGLKVIQFCLDRSITMDSEFLLFLAKLTAALGGSDGSQLEEIILDTGITQQNWEHHWIKDSPNSTPSDLTFRFEGHSLHLPAPRLIPHLTHLRLDKWRHVRMGVSTLTEFESFRGLFDIFTDLSHIRLQLRRDPDATDSFDPKLSWPVSTSLPLKSLTLDGTDLLCSHFLCTAGRAFEQLTTLAFPCSGSDSHYNNVFKHLPNLTSLTPHDMRLTTCEVFTLLPHLRILRGVILDRYFHYHEEEGPCRCALIAPNEMAKCLPSLTSIQIGQWRELMLITHDRPTPIAEFLSSLPKLQNYRFKDGPMQTATKYDDIRRFLIESGAAGPDQSNQIGHVSAPAMSRSSFTFASPARLATPTTTTPFALLTLTNDSIINTFLATPTPPLAPFTFTLDPSTRTDGTTVTTAVASTSSPMTAPFTFPKFEFHDTTRITPADTNPFLLTPPSNPNTSPATVPTATTNTSQLQFSSPFSLAAFGDPFNVANSTNPFAAVTNPFATPVVNPFTTPPPTIGDSIVSSLGDLTLVDATASTASSSSTTASNGILPFQLTHSPAPGSIFIMLMCIITILISSSTVVVDAATTNSFYPTDASSSSTGSLPYTGRTSPNHSLAYYMILSLAIQGVMFIGFLVLFWYIPTRLLLKIVSRLYGFEQVTTIEQRQEEKNKRHRKRTISTNQHQSTMTIHPDGDTSVSPSSLSRSQPMQPIIKHKNFHTTTAPTLRTHLLAHHSVNELNAIQSQSSSSNDLTHSYSPPSYLSDSDSQADYFHPSSTSSFSSPRFRHVTTTSLWVMNEMVEFSDASILDEELAMEGAGAEDELNDHSHTFRQDSCCCTYCCNVLILWPCCNRGCRCRPNSRRHPSGHRGGCPPMSRSHRIVRLLKAILGLSLEVALLLFIGLVLLDSGIWRLHGSGQCPSEVTSADDQWDCFLYSRAIGVADQYFVDCSLPIPADLIDYSTIACYRFLSLKADANLAALGTIASLFTLVFGGVATIFSWWLSSLSKVEQVRWMYLIPVAISITWWILFMQGYLPTPIGMISPLIIVGIISALIKIRMLVGFEREQNAAHSSVEDAPSSRPRIDYNRHESHDGVPHSSSAFQSAVYEELKDGDDSSDKASMVLQPVTSIPSNLIHASAAPLKRVHHVPSMPTPINDVKTNDTGATLASSSAINPVHAYSPPPIDLTTQGVEPNPGPINPGQPDATEINVDDASSSSSTSSRSLELHLSLHPSQGNQSVADPSTISQIQMSIDEPTSEQLQECRALRLDELEAIKSIYDQDVIIEVDERPHASPSNSSATSTSSSSSASAISTTATHPNRSLLIRIHPELVAAAATPDHSATTDSLLVRFDLPPLYPAIRPLVMTMTESNQSSLIELNRLIIIEKMIKFLDTTYHGDEPIPMSQASVCIFDLIQIARETLTELSTSDSSSRTDINDSSNLSGSSSTATTAIVIQENPSSIESSVEVVGDVPHVPPAVDELSDFIPTPHDLSNHLAQFPVFFSKSLELGFTGYYFEPIPVASEVRQRFIDLRQTYLATSYERGRISIGFRSCGEWQFGDIIASGVTENGKYHMTDGPDFYDPGLYVYESPIPPAQQLINCRGHILICALLRGSTYTGNTPPPPTAPNRKSSPQPNTFDSRVQPGSGVGATYDPAGTCWTLFNSSGILPIYILRRSKSSLKQIYPRITIFPFQTNSKASVTTTTTRYPPNPSTASTVVKSVPAKPLIGIETNPGPGKKRCRDSGDSYSPIPPPQDSNGSISRWVTMPKDWLDQISTYLTLNELIHLFGRSCHYWFNVLQTIKSRQLKLKYSSLGQPHLDRSKRAELRRTHFDQFLHSPYRRHFSCIILRASMDDATISRMTLQLPHLKQLIGLELPCGLDASSSDAVERSITFPLALEELSLKLIPPLHIFKSIPYRLEVTKILTHLGQQATGLKKLKLSLPFGLIPPDAFNSLPDSLEWMEIDGPFHLRLLTEHFEVFSRLPHLSHLGLDNYEECLSHSQLLALTTPTMNEQTKIARLTSFSCQLKSQPAIELLGRLRALQQLLLDLSEENLIDLSCLGELSCLNKLTLVCSEEVSFDAVLTGLKYLHHRDRRLSRLDDFALAHPGLSSTQLAELMPFLIYVQRVFLFEMNQCKSFEFLQLPTTSIVEWKGFRFDTTNSFQLTRPYSHIFSPTHFPHLQEVRIAGRHQLNFNWYEEIINPTSTHFRSDLWPNLKSFQIVLAKNYQPYASAPSASVSASSLADTIMTISDATVQQPTSEIEFNPDVTSRTVNSVATPFLGIPESPPVEPLVGIELNPGPSSCPTLYDPILVQCVTAQSLFNDGLHLLYSYLNTADWVSAFHSCRLWYAAAQTEPSRHLICPTHRMNVITPTCPPATLRHHFTSIQSAKSKFHAIYLDTNDLLTALDWFPHINRIFECNLQYRSSTSSGNSIPHIPTDLIYSRLTHCELRLPRHAPMGVIRHILTHAPNLEVVCIGSFYDKDETALFQMLEPIQSLTNLKELTVASDYVLNFSPLPHLPTTLTSLSIHLEYPPCWEQLLSFQLPNLTHCDLWSRTLRIGDLKRLHRTAPNLTQIEPYDFALKDLSDLHLFHHVESITFRNSPPCELDQLPDDLATVLTNLTFCHTLIRLTFHCWYPASADLWMKYAQELPLLTALQLKEDTHDHPLIEWLLPLKDRLKQLHLHRALKQDGCTLLLNGIDQFSELEELSFANRLTSEQSSLIRDYFNNSSLLPKLRRLLIGGQSYVPNSFLFDKALGLNVDTYRLPIKPPTSTSTQLAANSNTTQVTGQLDGSTTCVTLPASAERLAGAELHPSSTSTTMPSTLPPLPPPRSVMPERLVGIETNPGPVRTDNDLGSSNCSMTPHIIFKDGLLIIYSYLSTTDWSHAYRTCRHWYSVTLNERSRQISFPLRLIECMRLLPPTRFIHHFTTFHHYPDLASSFKRTSHFLTLIHTLPHLTSIKAKFDHQTIDDGNWSGMNITWPTALTALTLNCYQVTHIISLVQSLASVPQLSQLVLSLPGYWEKDFERFRTEVVLPDPVTTADSDSSSHNSKSLLSSHLSWSNLICQLTYLNIFKGAKFIRMIPPHAKWPKLQSIDLSALNLEPGELKRLHECAPNLKQLTPILLCEEDFADVALFESLDTIQITLDRGPSLRQEAIVTSALLKCKHLTHLIFRRWMLLTPESWSKLSESHLGTQLTHLEFMWSNPIQFQGFEAITLDAFHRFLHLRSLVIHMNVGVRPEELRAHFDSSSVLPHLRRFVLARHSLTEFEWNIESGMNVANFRTQPIEDTLMDQTTTIVPAARLVGIEPNPGPVVLSGLFAPASHFTRPWRFGNTIDQILEGVIYSLPFSDSQGGRRCALLCRGVLASKEDESFYPELTAELKRAHYGQLQHVALFEFSGPHGGESADEFRYNYAHMVSEILCAVRSLELGHGLEVIVLVGHSMAANAVLLYASLYSNVPHVVAINPRYSLSIDEHVSKADLLELLRDGHMQVRLPHRPNEPVRISLEDYRQRLCTDMSLVRKIGQHVHPVRGCVEEMHTLLVHQPGADGIPLQDVQSLHQWMVAKQPLQPDEPMDARAQACTCILPDAVLQQPILQPTSFHPHLSKSTPHTFVPLPAQTGTDPSIRARLLLRTVCTWIREHSLLYNLCGDLKDQRTLPTRTGEVNIQSAASSQSEDESKAEVDSDDEDEDEDEAASAQLTPPRPSQKKEKVLTDQIEELQKNHTASTDKEVNLTNEIAALKQSQEESKLKATEREEHLKSEIAELKKIQQESQATMVSQFNELKRMMMAMALQQPSLSASSSVSATTVVAPIIPPFMATRVRGPLNPALTAHGTAQHLFVDGLLLIFGFLPFRELLSALHSCHYWYECGLRERSRQLVCTLPLDEFRKSKSDRNLTRIFSSILVSPLRFHIGSLLNFPIEYISVIFELPLLHLHTLTCEFVGAHPPRSSSSHVFHAKRDPSKFTLPNSLIILKIKLSTLCPFELGEAFINSLPTGTRITTIDLVYEDLSGGTFAQPVNLSSLTRLPALTNLSLNLPQSSRLVGQQLCAQLSLTTFRLNPSYSYDWTILHSGTPLMNSIQEWYVDCFHQNDWTHLLTVRPPQLHTMRIEISISSPSLVGLPALNLKTLSLICTSPFGVLQMNRGSSDVPILSACDSLTALELNGYKLTDQHLRQILIALVGLEELKLTGEVEHIEVGVATLEYLPPHTFIKELVFDFFNFDSFICELSNSKRLKSIEIDDLLLNESDDLSYDDLTRICQQYARTTMKPGFSLRINNFFGTRFTFHNLNRMTPTVHTIRTLDADAERPQ